MAIQEKSNNAMILSLYILEKKTIYQTIYSIARGQKSTVRHIFVCEDFRKLTLLFIPLTIFPRRLCTCHKWQSWHTHPSNILLTA